MAASPLGAMPCYSRDELEVLSELEGDEPFVDEEFGPHGESLGEISAADVSGWRRLPIDSLFEEGVPPGDLEPAGAGLDDVFFAGALATVATRADLLLRLFVSVDNEDRGMLTLRFFKHGAWRNVLIDTMVR